MIIAGFDPGSNIFGIGLIEISGSQFKYVMSEELKFPKVEFNEKMEILIHRISDVFKEYPVAGAAIEDGFLGKNVRSMNILSKVRGVVLAAAIADRKKLSFYSPREIKTSVTGNGNAGKEQVMKGVRMLLGITNLPEMGYDESDALAVALCHSLMKKRSDLIK